jgi:bifunctional non-homologous end joining protein LigD
MRSAARSEQALLAYRRKRHFDATPEPTDHSERVAARKAITPAKRAPLPRVKDVERPTLVDAPFDDPDWLFEIKWDGFRALATIHEDGRVAVVSRNGKDLAARFPELADLDKAFATKPLMVDGEIVALDDEGKSSFQRLQNRDGGRAGSIAFVAFDVLYADGRDRRSEPLEQRKKVLEGLVRVGAKNVLFSKHVVEKGIELFAVAQKQGLEGIVGKRRDSVYREGRTRDWVKIKTRLEQECVIGGWTEPTGSRAGFGSLVLGLYEQGRFVHCGNVGTGFDAATIRVLMKKLRPLAVKTSPFHPPPKTRTRAHWVRPKLVAQVRFTEWTNDGSMRHPTFLGLRDDKNPRDCHRERPRAAAEVA